MCARGTCVRVCVFYRRESCASAVPNSPARSAYVSRRQNTSVQRQHTSAYVSIRQGGVGAEVPWNSLRLRRCVIANGVMRHIWSLNAIIISRTFQAAARVRFLKAETGEGRVRKFAFKAHPACSLSSALFLFVTESSFVALLRFFFFEFLGRNFFSWICDRHHLFKMMSRFVALCVLITCASLHPVSAG